jgi:hypothetical protein
MIVRLCSRETRNFCSCFEFQQLKRWVITEEKQVGNVSSLYKAKIATYVVYSLTLERVKSRDCRNLVQFAVFRSLPVAGWVS